MAVSPLMPTHILNYSKKGRVSKVALAKRALKMLRLKIDSEGLISIEPRKKMGGLRKPKWDHRETLVFCSAADGTVDVSKIQGRAQRQAFRQYMQRNKNFKCVKTNIFVPVTDQAQTTKEGQNNQ